MGLGPVDYAIMLIYVGAVLAIGWTLRSYMKTSSDFLTSGRSIPAWVTGLAFISANLGALELVGMAASGAKYGIATAHFYWVGAIPAMIFLAVFMMPFYYGSKARSVPEYLKMRFDERVRCLNSMTFAVMTVFASGISMNALAKLLNQLLGWDYNLSLWICSAVVLVYVLKGGLTSAIYTEVLQFFMIVLGFAPVVYLALKDVGGWSVMNGKLAGVAQNPSALALNNGTFAPDAWTSAWKPLLGGPSANPMGVDIFAMVFGLGFVLSFGYWCTNFLVVQRAMAAKNMTAARRTPLIAAVPKMIFPILVIVPGMLAVALASIGARVTTAPASHSRRRRGPGLGRDKTASMDQIDAVVQKLNDAAGIKFVPGQSRGHRQRNAAAACPRPRFMPACKKRRRERLRRRDPLAGQELLSAGTAGPGPDGPAGVVHVRHGRQCHGLQHGLDLRPLPGLHRPQQERRPLHVDGPRVTVVGILLSIGCAYFASQYNNAMDIIQLVFGFVNAPLFATFLLGMFWARTTGTAPSSACWAAR